MSFLPFLFIFLLGLAVGSFLNAVQLRLEKGESALQGRSYCPHCHHVLAFQDLIPVLSFFWLQGKCRYCSKQISLQYPLVEISTAVIFLTIFNFEFLIFNEFLIPQFLKLLYLFIITSLLIIIFVHDLRHYIIPDKIIYSAIGITLLYRVFELGALHNWDFIRNSKLEIGNFEPLTNALFAALLAAGFFLIIFLVSRGRWMGFGDVKLVLFMGLFLGWPNILVALFLAFLIGAIIGIGLISLKKKEFKSEIPFGPFLILGTFIALIFGNKLIHWYSNLII